MDSDYFDQLKSQFDEFDKPPQNSFKDFILNCFRRHLLLYLGIAWSKDELHLANYWAHAYSNSSFSSVIDDIFTDLVFYECSDDAEWEEGYYNFYEPGDSPIINWVSHDVFLKSDTDLEIFQNRLAEYGWFSSLDSAQLIVSTQVKEKLLHEGLVDNDNFSPVYVIVREITPDGYLDTIPFEKLQSLRETKSITGICWLMKSNHFCEVKSYYPKHTGKGRYTMAFGISYTPFRLGPGHVGRLQVDAMPGYLTKQKNNNNTNILHLTDGFSSILPVLSSKMWDVLLTYRNKKDVYLIPVVDEDDLVTKETLENRFKDLLLTKLMFA
jgi:hypothetical protein